MESGGLGSSEMAKLGIGRLFWAISFAFAFLWIASSPRDAWSANAEVYHGQVLDAETEQPIEGAVVTLIWFKSPYLALEPSRYFHSGKEVLTDSHGRFSVDASPGRNWNPLMYMLAHPWIVIFRPGYAPLTPTYAVALGLGADMYDKLKQGAVVRLPRLKDKNDQIKFSDLGAVGIVNDVPRSAILNLIRAINVQRRQTGLRPFSGI